MEAVIKQEVVEKEPREVILSWKEKPKEKSKFCNMFSDRLAEHFDECKFQNSYLNILEIRQIDRKYLPANSHTCSLQTGKHSDHYFRNSASPAILKCRNLFISQSHSALKRFSQPIKLHYFDFSGSDESTHSRKQRLFAQS